MGTAARNCPGVSAPAAGSGSGSSRSSDPERFTDIEIASNCIVRFAFNACSDSQIDAALNFANCAANTTDTGAQRPALQINISDDLVIPTEDRIQIQKNLMVAPSGVWLLDSTGNAIVELPFGSWKEQVSVVVTPHKVDWVLRAMMPFIATRCGLLPGHGAAYVDANLNGIALSGLPNSGKTGAMLAAIQRGGQYLSDDIVLIDPEKLQLVTTSLAIEVAYPYLKDYPQFANSISGRAFLKLRLKAFVAFAARRLLPPAIVYRLLPASAAKRWDSATSRRPKISVSKQALFRECQQASSARLHQVALLTPTSEVNETTSLLSPADATMQWQLAIRQDTSAIRALYDQYRYTSCAAVSPLIESFDETVENMLERVFRQIPAYRVHTHWSSPNPERTIDQIEQLQYGR